MSGLCTGGLLHLKNTSSVSSVSSVSRLLSAYAALLLALSGSAGAAEFTFAALGDTPYAAHEEEQFPELIAEMNREPLAFVVHIGDFKAAWTRCTDELFAQRRAWFDLSRHPFVFLPGDNEWVDCARRTGGGYDPLERLARLRALFAAGPGSLGQRRLALERQLPDYPEHARWRLHDVLFVALNVPGGANNARHMPDEYQRRSRAVERWLAQGFEIARRAGLPALVVFLHANPWASPSSRYFGYRDLLAQLAREAGGFRGEVLIVHGDTHRHRVDRPLRDAAGEPVRNVLRVEVPGYPAMNWLRIRVRGEAGQVRFEIEPAG